MQGYEPVDSFEGLLDAEAFHARHIGPSHAEQQSMLQALGVASVEDLIQATVPEAILSPGPLALPEPETEVEALSSLREIARHNQVWRTYIGAGYFGTHTPEPIKRNLLENPGWYTAYTPYQAEVAQGRLEALMNFQQVVVDLTGLPTANASLLDEATAAAEAMGMFLRANKRAPANRYLVDTQVHPQVIAVIKSRAAWLGVEVMVCDCLDASVLAAELPTAFGVHVQTPNTQGRVLQLESVAEQVHANGARLAVGCDLLSLMLL